LIVREGKLAELKTAIRELAEFVAANEPRVIGYGAYFNAPTILNPYHQH
jgi:hypothetical protein